MSEMNPGQQGPRKVFREEAKPESVQCLSCGGPIQLRAFGQIEQVSCPYCGSTLSPDQSGAFELLQRVERERRQSRLPLGKRGKFDGIEFEVIGVCWRQAWAEGVAYPWQEFMLFNPYHGYRWLIFSMTDGSWMFGEALPGAPEKVGITHKSLKFQGKKYKHFSSAPAEVTYVEGEFPWQVEVGDRAVAEDYVAPPVGLSVEISDSEGGSEINFTQMRHIDADEVWSSLGMEGNPPRQSGVGLVQPNPHRANGGWYWKLFALLLAIWAAATFFYVSTRDEKLIVDETNIPHATVLSTELDFLEEGKVGTLEVEFAVPGLSNSWGYADVLLVKQGGSDALNFGAEADEWHGSDYQEGTNPQSVTVGGLEGGKYTLQVTPQFDPAHTARMPDATYSIRVRQDVPMGLYVGLPLILIFLFPLLNTLRGAMFEGRRWSNSDYAGDD